jgi:hypothetical protein
MATLFRLGRDDVAIDFVFNINCFVAECQCLMETNASVLVEVYCTVVDPHPYGSIEWASRFLRLAC